MLKSLASVLAKTIRMKTKPMDPIKIIKGRAIPEGTRSRVGRYHEFFTTGQPGDSIDVKSKTGTGFYALARRYGVKITVRRVPETGCLGVWILDRGEPKVAPKAKKR